MKKRKYWQEEIKSKIKKLSERAKEKPKPKPKKIRVKVYEKPVTRKETVTIEHKDHYAEIKTEESKIREKPEIPVDIKKKNHYAVIKPIVDDIKAKAKEDDIVDDIKAKAKEELKELREAKVKDEEFVHKKKEEKTEVPKEKVEPSKIEIETTIDEMIDIINERGSVSTFHLAKKLGISVEQVEILAKILEDRDLIEIEYPLIGYSKLRKKNGKKNLK